MAVAYKVAAFLAGVDFRLILGDDSLDDSPDEFSQG
jgi:hypothetical protein